MNPKSRFYHHIRMGCGNGSKYGPLPPPPRLRRIFCDASKMNKIFTMCTFLQNIMEDYDNVQDDGYTAFLNVVRLWLFCTRMIDDNQFFCFLSFSPKFNDKKYIMKRKCAKNKQPLTKPASTKPSLNSFLKVGFAKGFCWRCISLTSCLSIA